MGYREDQLLRIIENLDRRTNQDDDPIAQAENTIEDVLVSLVETTAHKDTMKVAYFVPSTFCWGSGRSVSASSPSDWGSRSNVTL